MDECKRWTTRRCCGNMPPGIRNRLLRRWSPATPLWFIPPPCGRCATHISRPRSPPRPIRCPTRWGRRFCAAPRLGFAGLLAGDHRHRGGRRARAAENRRAGGWNFPRRPSSAWNGNGRAAPLKENCKTASWPGPGIRAAAASRWFLNAAVKVIYVLFWNLNFPLIPPPVSEVRR